MFHQAALFIFLLTSTSFFVHVSQRETAETRSVHEGRSTSSVAADSPSGRLQANDHVILMGRRLINPQQSIQTLPKTSLPTSSGCGVVAKRDDITKVAGGRKVHGKAMPWMVSFSTWDNIQDTKNITFCGGTLISDRHILTAAHCFTSENNRWMCKEMKSPTELDDRIYIGLGNNDVVEQWNYNGSEVQFIHIHEGYDKVTHENDIALITLKDPVQFDDDIQPICLPLNINSAKLVSFENQTAHIAGWGYVITDPPAQSDILLEADIPVIGLEQCKKEYEKGKFKVTDRHICAMRQGVDACRGDSGGPLMYETTENKWVVIGIVSWGSEYCDGRVPGVYTRVTSYLDWIEKKQLFHDETDPHERLNSALFRIKKLEDFAASQQNHVILSRPPSSCQDLRSIGHSHSGFYHVQGSNGVDSVYCDMSKAVSDNGFEDRIGRVEIKSRSVFFFVSRLSEFSVRGSVIPFEIEVMNIGGAMDTRKGLFTAPVGGIYFFSFSGVKSAFSKDLNVELRLNGGKRVQGYATSVDIKDTRSTVSLQSTLQLRTGDQVDLLLHVGVLWSKYNTTQFIGFLVQQDF